MVIDAYFTFKIITIVKTSETFDLNSIIIYILLSIILIILICYPIICLKIKRFHDLWIKLSFFSKNNNILELNNKWNDLENEYWKREIIFDVWKNTKILLITIPILILISLMILFPRYIILKYS
jgi:uncharacterized membrane protein YhaH (DUF805 family)